MVKIYNTNTLAEQTLDFEESLWVYNGIDCAVTKAVWDANKDKLDNPNTKVSYDFVMAMRAPAIDMMTRGILIDTSVKFKLEQDLSADFQKLQNILNRYALEVWLKPLNPLSPKQLIDFLYGVMGLPKKFSFKKGIRKLSTDRDALEKLLATSFYAKPIIRVILKIKEISKKLGVVRTAIDPDGRIRTSYNVCGTDTGRWSSSENPFRKGTNLQNITDRLRVMMIADEGKKFAYIDLDQAESRLVAYLSGDENYIEACEGADLHTQVCKMIWKDLAWSGKDWNEDPEALAYDKNKIAGATCYQHFSYRDMAKRGGHGTNYYGKAANMAKFLHISTEVMQDFQDMYFDAFPNIRRWHTKTAELLQTKGYLMTPLGRKRCFFGRLTDDTTLRAAIAHVPQSSIGEILNLAMWRLWRYEGSGSQLPSIELLAQVHDAVLIQYPERREAAVIEEALKHMTVSCPVTDIINQKTRMMTLPCSAESGWNWQHYTKENTDGIKGFSGVDARTRTTQPTESVLDYRF